MKIHPFIMSIVIQLICLNIMSGQCPDPGPFYPALDSFYTNVNRAESFIADENFWQAITCYNRASQFRPLDYIDRINLLHCYLGSDMMPQAVSMIIEMSEDKSALIFLNDKVYTDLINDENWIYYVENEYKAPPKYPIRNEWKKMFNDFQLTFSMKNKDSIDLIIKDIGSKIRKMISEDGYPTEQALGNGESTYSSAPSGWMFMTDLSVALEDTDTKADSLLLSLLLKGDIAPEIFVGLSSRHGSKSCGCDPLRDTIYLEYKNNLYTCNKKKEEEVDKCRKLLHIQSIANAKKIIEYQDKHPQFRFRASYNVISVYFLPHNVVETFDIKDYEGELVQIKHFEQNYRDFKK